MGRKHRRRPRPDGSRPGGGGLGPEAVEEHPDGTWVVRRVSGSAATKPYRCPGCDQEVRPATPHVVAWPTDDLGGLERPPALAHRLLAGPGPPRSGDPARTPAAALTRRAGAGPAGVLHPGVVTQPAAAPPADLLEQGEPGQRPRRWPWLLAAALVVLVLGARALDAAWSEREAVAVVDEVAQAQDEVALAQARIAGMVAYSMPLLTSAEIDPALRADLEGLVSTAAAQAVQPLRERRDALADLVVLPWHGPVRAARVASLGYLDARVAELEAVAADAGARGWVRPDVEATRLGARAALLAATADPGLLDRVDRVLPDPDR